MGNNPYSTPTPDEYIIQEKGKLPVEVKRAWNRFYDTNRQLYRWWHEGKPERVKAKMWKWEKRNQEAWSMGFEVPDEFDPNGPPPKMRLRRDR